MFQFLFSSPFFPIYEQPKGNGDKKSLFAMAVLLMIVVVVVLLLLLATVPYSIVTSLESEQAASIRVVLRIV